MAQDTSADDNKILVSLQALLDLCGAAQSGASALLGQGAISQLRISVITLAQARAEIDAATDPSQRRRLTTRLQALVARLTADGEVVLGFGSGAAIVWQGLLMEPSLDDMPQIDRQFYATALFEGTVVAEYPHAHSQALAELGVRVLTLP